MHPRFYFTSSPYIIQYRLMKTCRKIVSEPATNHVRTCITELYYHIKRQTMCIAFFPIICHIYLTCCIDISHMYMAYTSSDRVCMQLIPLSPAYALVDDTFEIPFTLSFCSGYSDFFTHFYRCHCSSKLDL
jgi:hypothetical protein